jgi:hypothetical protein
MKSEFNKLFLRLLTALSMASLGVVVVAQTHAGGGRAGGGARTQATAGGGARAQAAASGQTRQTAQVNNSRADVRSNNVRNTSVNNVNVQRNVNVNVEGNGGWDNDYHPVAAVAAVGATAAVIGSMVRTVPSNCVPVNYGGVVYQQCGSTWYQPQGSQYVVVNPPY